MDEQDTLVEAAAAISAAAVVAAPRLVRVRLPVEALNALLPKLGPPAGCQVERISRDARDAGVSLSVSGEALPERAEGAPIPEWPDPAAAGRILADDHAAPEERSVAGRALRQRKGTNE